MKRDVLFGEEALKNRLALNLFRPLELGVIKDTKEDREFIAHFITHLIGLSDPEDHDRVVAVIGAPAEASHVDKTAIFDAAAGSVNAAMIISEPFAVAYALDMIEHTLVIDIGAGTTDLCRVYGTIPGPGDQMHTGYAGDYVDAQIIKEVQSKYNGAQITKDMARRWKEQYSFVSTSTPDGPIMVDFSIEGKAMNLDITDCMQRACESIVEPIVENVKKLIAAPTRNTTTSSAEIWFSLVADQEFVDSVLSSNADSPTWATSMFTSLTTQSDSEQWVAFVWPWKSQKKCGLPSLLQPAEFVHQSD